MKDYRIQEFGAVGDGVTMNTQAIQQAIDTAAADGGGRVVITEGTFKTGSIQLRSYVELEDVTMVNQPSGWSYWIHDCDFVQVRGLNILADVNYPNNDGLHINCSRYVTVSDCNMTCGDDCIIIRANSVSLKENKPCEQVTITNCNLTSYSAAVRIGWDNDGVIRNCTLSNLVIKDSSVGFSFLIPGRMRKPFTLENSSGSDVGREATLIENLTFSNIIMDKQCSYPVFVSLADNDYTHIAAVRNLHFSHLHSRGPEFPYLQGKPDCPIENVTFSDCTFEVTDGSEFDNRASHGPIQVKDLEYHPMHVRHVKNLHFNNTEFTVC